MFPAGDEGVIQTNDDATACKRSAVRLGYWKDPFIEHFVGSHRSSSFSSSSSLSASSPAAAAAASSLLMSHPKSIGNRFDRKAPEINRGYYARVQAFAYLLDQYFEMLQLYNSNPHHSASSPTTTGHSAEARPLKCQIINIGCGYDTLFWRLKSSGKTDLVASFVDLDLPSVTCKKLHHIRAPQSPLLPVLGEDIRCNQFELHSSEYHLVACDLRNVPELHKKLFDECHLDASLPTLVISECVLVYMSRSDTHGFLRWSSGAFSNCLIVNYEQVNVFDKFGEVMVENLRQRGCEIMDIDACRDLNTQSSR